MSDGPLRVAVNGATGFVGIHVVRELTERGHQAVALVRAEANPRDLEVLESAGARAVPVDLQREDSLAEAMQGCDRLVHLIGSIAPRKGTRFEDLHQGMAARFFRAAKTSGVTKVAMITALGAGPDAGSMYHRTKWLSEEALRGSGLSYTVLRPSLIVGRVVGHRDSKMVRRYVDLIENKRKVPLIFGGKNLVQPIFVGDLAKAVCEVLEKSDWDGATLELGGGEVMTTRQLIERIMQVLDIRKGFVTVPGPLAWCAATVLEAVMEVPLLSRDQLRIAKINGICQRNALVEDLGIPPAPLPEVLEAYRG